MAADSEGSRLPSFGQRPGNSKLRNLSRELLVGLLSILLPQVNLGGSPRSGQGNGASGSGLDEHTGATDRLGTLNIRFLAKFGARVATHFVQTCTHGADFGAKLLTTRAPPDSHADPLERFDSVARLHAGLVAVSLAHFVVCSLGTLRNCPARLAASPASASKSARCHRSAACSCSRSHGIGWPAQWDMQQVDPAASVVALLD